MAFVSLFHSRPCSSNLTTTPFQLLYLPYFMYNVWYFHPKHFSVRYRAIFYLSKCGGHSMKVDQINSGSIFTRISTYRLGPIGSVWSYNGRIHSVPSTFLRGALSLKCTQFQINYTGRWRTLLNCAKVRRRPYRKTLAWAFLIWGDLAQC